MHILPWRNSNYLRHGVFSVGMALTLALGSARADDTVKHPLMYAPAPVNNPLKGLVPYAGDHGGGFPHSMEFNYLPLSALVVGEDLYDWKALERLLNDIASRGHQAIFRVYLEYPGKKSGIPDYLLTKGLKVYRYTNTNTVPFPPTQVETPDYSDKNLRDCLQRFIAALGKTFDGDPRIGFITAGLLGTWGEWHTYPRNDLWAGKDVQTEVMDAYESAFTTTPILLRYPAGKDHNTLAPNAGRHFGYHDDSFAWATLDTSKKEELWFFLPSLKAAGPRAMDAWKYYPIGGEIRPEAWGKVFDALPGDSHIQDFAKCVRETHVTWLMDTGMFQSPNTHERGLRAEAQVRKMGYEFYVRSVSVRQNGRNLNVTTEIENRGVAPFYYAWRPEIALLSSRGDVRGVVAGSGRLTGLLPGEPARLWEDRLDCTGLKPGTYHLALRVPNPIRNGIPLRFANDTQDRHASGWLSLCDVTLRK